MNLAHKKTQFQLLETVHFDEERDSNPRYPLGVHTLSRRANSATLASLLIIMWLLFSRSKVRKKPIEKLFAHFANQTFIQVQFDFIMVQSLPQKEH